jgi:hypothetical protein
LPALVVSSTSPSPVTTTSHPGEDLVEAEQIEHRGRARDEFRPERRERHSEAAGDATEADEQRGRMSA